jgi:hypothetical protein
MAWTSDCSLEVIRSFRRSTGSNGDGEVKKTCLVFLFPVENIFDPAKAAHIDVFAWLDQHIGRGDDESWGRFARV